MSSSAVSVFVRTRPSSSASPNIHIGSSEVSVHRPAPDDHTPDTLDNTKRDFSFAFPQPVLHNASQNAVFNSVGLDLVDSFIDGFNATVLCYGQTGAGKTHTMTGPSQYKHRGLTPRAISRLFAHIGSHPERSYSVRVSYLEIYNETFYDLLRDDLGANSTTELAVTTDARSGQVVVRGLTCAPVSSEEEALNLLFEGETNRTIAEHQLNKASTRSHCIFTLHLESQSRVESDERVTVSKLNLVDLAGSERVGKTGSSGVTLEEAKYINRSLSFLEQVVIALGSRGRDHIPFRQSKLTNVLRDSLGGNCKTRLVANIWPEERHLHETISTLRFASRMMRVSTEATVNVKLDPAAQLRKYEREIRELKQELAMHDTLANRSGISYDDYTPEQQLELRHLVHQYVGGEVEEIEIESLRQVRELFKQFRQYARELEQSGGRVAGGSADQSMNEDPQEQQVSEQSSPRGNAQQSAKQRVGDLDMTLGGFGIGQAPADSRPPPSPIPHQRREPSSPSPAASPRTLQPAEESSPADASSAPAAPAMTEAEALEHFKLREGRELSDRYEENKRASKENKQSLRAISQQVNQVKREIDAINEQLRAKREARRDEDMREDGVEVIDEEEYALIRDLKAKKHEYKEAYHERQVVQSELTYVKGLVKQSKRALADAFLRWFADQHGVSLVAEENSSAVAQEDGGRAEDLDAGEAFELQETRNIMEEDPDALSFYKARKRVEANAKRKKKQPRQRGLPQSHW